MGQIGYFEHIVRMADTVGYRPVVLILIYCNSVAVHLYVHVYPPHLKGTVYRQVMVAHP